MKKTLAISLSLFALVYVGLAYADDYENKNEQGAKQEEQDDQEEKVNEREQKKKQYEQEREALKQEWENDKEETKNVKEKFKNEFQLRLEEKKKLREEFRQKLTEERCANITNRVQERTSHFDERGEGHKKVYDNLVNRISKFISRFKAAGISTTNLDGYLVELKNKIAKFRTDYAAYITKLKESKSLTCGHAEGEFRAIMVDAKALLKVVHADAADIKNYVRTTILPEIKVLKAQMPEEDERDDNKNKTPDTIAPTVSITSPASETNYTAPVTVAISARASDNDKVEKVEFYEDGILKGKDEDTPYSFNWTITSADNGTHSWTAKAYDDAEPANAATSLSVSLTVNIATP